MSHWWVWGPLWAIVLWFVMQIVFKLGRIREREQASERGLAVAEGFAQSTQDTYNNHSPEARIGGWEAGRYTYEDGQLYMDDYYHCYGVFPDSEPSDRELDISDHPVLSEEVDGIVHLSVPALSMRTKYGLKEVTAFFHENEPINMQLPIYFRKFGKACVDELSAVCPSCQGDIPDTHYHGIVGMDPEQSSVTFFGVGVCRPCNSYITTAGQVTCNPGAPKGQFLQIVDRPDLTPPWAPKPKPTGRALDLDL